MTDGSMLNSFIDTWFKLEKVMERINNEDHPLKHSDIILKAYWSDLKEIGERINNGNRPIKQFDIVTDEELKFEIGRIVEVINNNTRRHNLPANLTVRTYLYDLMRRLGVIKKGCYPIEQDYIVTDEELNADDLF